MYEHLIEFYNKKKHNIKRYHENSPEAIEIRSLTSFLDDSKLFSKIGYKQRIWHIINNQLSLKTCVICNKPVRWDDGNKRYSDTCCKECFLEYSKSDVIKNKIKETNLSKYGAITYSQTEEGKLKQQQICLRKYGVDNPAKASDYKEKAQKTCLEKYGVDNSAKIVDYKKKTQKTCLEKYGVEHYTQTEEYKERSKKTCLKRYNVEHPSQSEIIKERSRQTCLEKYGVDNPAKADDYNEKSKKTCLQKYGVEYISKLPEIVERQKESFRKTCFQRYNVSHYSKSQQYTEDTEKSFIEKLNEDGYSLVGYQYIKYLGDCNHKLHCPNCNNDFIINSSDQYYYRHKNKHKICTICNPLHKPYSCGEKEVLSYISSIYDGTILENDRTIIKPKELDIYLPELHLAIEYNGDYWHANPKYYSEDHIIGDVPAKTVWKEDKQKINRCIKAGIELLVIWEDDWTNRKEQVQFELNNIITELMR